MKGGDSLAYVGHGLYQVRRDDGGEVKKNQRWRAEKEEEEKTEKTSEGEQQQEQEEGDERVIDVDRLDKRRDQRDSTSLSQSLVKEARWC